MDRGAVIKWIAVGLAVGVSALGGWYALGFAGPTGARRVAWFDADGARLPTQLTGADGWTGCHGDIHLRTLVVGSRVWTICTGSERTSYGALAAIDTDTLQGRVAWPMPEELPLAWVEAVQPHGDRLAVVYKVDGRGHLAAAVAGPDGWIAPPRRVTGFFGSQVVGLAWHGEEAEAVVLPEEAEHPMGVGADPMVVRIGADGLHERRIPAQSLCVGECGWVQVTLAYMVDGRWQFLLGVGGRGNVVAEGGEPRPHALAIPYPWTRADVTVTGLVRDHAPVDQILQADGEVVANDPRLAALVTAGRVARGGDYVFEGGVLRRRARVQVDDSLVHLIGERTLVRELPDPQGEAVMSIVDRTEPAAPRSSAVARIASYSCGDLASPAFVAQADGGQLLVAPDGCYIELDAAGRRADPLDLPEHLRRRGSRGIDWHEPQHAWALAWVLLGLPVCLGVGAAIARVRTGRYAISPAAALIHALTAGYLLIELARLLR